MGQTLSSSNFFFYGKRHFTQTGYHRHVKQYIDPRQSSANIGTGVQGADGIDMSGKVVVVTGANSGLGKEVATYCAAKGARLYMLCRSKERAESARQEIMEKTGSDSINVVLVDVGELAQVREAVKSLQEREKKIHTLVCNAGVLLNEKRDSSEGVEATFASHLLGGTYLLSKLLLPQIQEAEEGRIIVVTSGGMYNYKLPSWETLTSTDGRKFDGVSAYAYAKRGQVLLAERWAKLYPDVKIVTVHPGWSDTPAVTEAFGDSTKYLQPLREPWEGAEGICWLAGTKGDNVQSGEFYLDREIAPKHISGPFYTEGSFTKNTGEEVDDFLKRMAEAAGV
mmetsp:Transcript_5605/g.7370  ORF Transcript_5605/g.7370 Transcript_5605/m.7370 type:complete len:338 (-) Transcript_5605:1044-2057(-)